VILEEPRKRKPDEEEILAAMRACDEDPDYMAEFHLWDVTLSDGLKPSPAEAV
jgi:hypothetical protein